MSSTHAKRRRVQRSHFKLSKNFILAFLLHVSVHCLGIMASPMVRKDVGYTPGSCQNGLEKRSEVLVARAAPKTQPISLAISWELSGQDASGRSEEIFHAMLLAIFKIHPATWVGFGEHTWVAFSKILSNMSSILHPIFTFYVVRLSCT